MLRYGIGLLSIFIGGLAVIYDLPTTSVPAGTLALHLAPMLLLLGGLIIGYSDGDRWS